MTPIAQLRAARLQHGVNLSHWYGQVYMSPGYTAEHYASYMQQSDLELIASMGFDHVRFPFALEQMVSGDPAAPLRSEFVDRVETEIERILALGLAVIVDPHPENEYKHGLAMSDIVATQFAAFWAALAARWSYLDPDRTVFEVLNEPGIEDASRWNAIQDEAFRKIRAAAPNHTVVLAGDQYSQVPELLRLEPAGTDNVIYNFHLYDPASFTHQGAHWAAPWVQWTRGLVYPPNRLNIRRLSEATTDSRALSELALYERTDWGPGAYGRLLGMAADWASAHGGPVICDEFGVYKEVAPRASRLEWLRDVTTAMRARGIGWTVWDYAGNFGVATGPRGGRQADRDVLAALGLD